MSTPLQMFIEASIKYELMSQFSDMNYENYIRHLLCGGGGENSHGYDI